MKLIDIVKDKKVKFVSFRENSFLYETEDGFAFHVPLDDIKGATLLAEDKAIYYMRWIRKHFNELNHE